MVTVETAARILPQEYFGLLIRINKLIRNSFHFLKYNLGSLMMGNNFIMF